MGYINTFLFLLHLEHTTQNDPSEKWINRADTCSLKNFVIYVPQEQTNTFWELWIFESEGES